MNGRTTPEPASDDPAGVPEAAPGLSVASVARRLGVAPATLRTWDRRYGLGPSAHTAGAHRRYSPGDIARLEIMRSLVFQGYSPADAAHSALAADVSAAASPMQPLPPSTPAAAVDPSAFEDLGGATADELDTDPGALSDDAGRRSDAVEAGLGAAGGRRAGGGRVVPIHGGSPRARGLARAALALDSPAVRRIVSESLAERGTVWTWDHLLAPVLIGVGQRFESTGQGVDLEHLLSEGIVGALRDVAETAPEDEGTRPVVLAAAPEDLHTLPLHAVAAGLAERGIPTRMLGARVPIDALVSAVRRCGPPAVMVWSHDPFTGEAEVLSAVPAVRPAPLVVVGGPGWPARLPEGVVRVGDLSDAINRLASAARGLT